MRYTFCGYAAVAVLAVGASQKRDGSREGLAAVGGFADQQVTVLGGAGQHIQLTPMDEHLSPEAGHQLADVMPALAFVIRTENKSQILRMRRGVEIHGRKKIAVRVPNERGGAEITARKGVGLVVGMQIVDDSSNRFAASRQAHTALFFACRYVELIIGVRRKALYVVIRFCGRSHKGEGFLATLAEENRVGVLAAGKPFKVDAVSLGGDLTNIRLSDLNQIRAVGRIAPGVGSFHACASFFT